MKYIINEPAKREKSAAKKGSGKSGETSSLDDAMFEAKVNWLGMRLKLVVSQYLVSFFLSQT